MVMPNQTKSTFKLGRGHESDLRITDISVSRLHALLKCTKDGFILEDNNSKFGTLILERGPVKLEPEVKKVVQVGRTVLYATVNPAKVSTILPITSFKSNAFVKQKKPASPPVQKKIHEGGKASPNSGDGNQMEDIPDEEEGQM